jgi:hypothetical protein
VKLGSDKFTELDQDVEAIGEVRVVVVDVVGIEEDVVVRNVVEVGTGAVGTITRDVGVDVVIVFEEVTVGELKTVGEGCTGVAKVVEVVVVLEVVDVEGPDVTKGDTGATGAIGATTRATGATGPTDPIGPIGPIGPTDATGMLGALGGGETGLFGKATTEGEDGEVDATIIGGGEGVDIDPEVWDIGDIGATGRDGEFIIVVDVLRVLPVDPEVEFEVVIDDEPVRD